MSFEAWRKLAEERIRQAVERGDFDNIEGMGKPMRLEDESHIPEDLRMAYKVLKNADCLPPELELRREITTTEDLLSGMKDEKERYRTMKKLNYLIMKLNMTRNTPVNLEKDQHYYAKVLDKVADEDEE